ncbi:MAG: ATP-binding protein [Thiobacillaceae bacterium]|jgi:two-component system sensor histidine kinase UhpB
MLFNKQKVLGFSVFAENRNLGGAQLSDMGTPKKITITDADMLPLVLQGSFNEILILDAGTLRVIQANNAARTKLQYTLRDLRSLTPFEILADKKSAASFIKTAQGLDGRKKNNSASFTSLFKRKDGTTYPVDIRVYLASNQDSARYIVIANDISDRNKSQKALDDTESNYRALISNIPGMAYQVVCDSKGRAKLLFVSDYSQAMLGIDSSTLQAKPKLFQDLILSEDRPSYLEGLEKAGGCQLTFNWEGRIWIKSWNDVKWVNIRVKKREQANGRIIWDGIMLNITQSKQAEAEIRRSRKQISELAIHVEQVKEQERLKVAREVHDELGGNLTAVKIGLSWLQKNLPEEQAKLLERARYLNSIVDQTMEATHRIASNLRPTIVEFGLVSAVQWQMKEFSQNLEIECLFTTTHEQIPLDPDASIAIFRIVQEALTNIAKHAGATKLWVNLQRKKHQFHLEIIDNGVGLKHAPKATANTFGILGMQERAAALGGELWVGEGAEGGTKVSLTVPLKP